MSTPLPADLAGQTVIVTGGTRGIGLGIVRHLARFPNDSIADVLENTFAFDAFDGELRKQLMAIFERHGIPLRAARPPECWCRKQRARSR